MNDRPIKNRVARALFKARSKCTDGLKELSIEMSSSLVESRSLIEMPLSESFSGRVGAEQIKG